MHYSIDKLVTRSGLVFGYGWAFEPNESTTAVSVEVQFPDESRQRISADYLKERDDVALHYPHEPAAARSGFVLYGELNVYEIDSADLVVEFAGGKSVRVPATFTRLDLRRSWWSRLSAAFAPGRLRRAWVLLRQRHFRQLWASFHAWRINSALLQRRADPIAIVRRLCNHSPAGRAVVVLDHMLGGGANAYRTAHVDQQLEAGRVVVLITFNMHRLEHLMDVQTSIERIVGIPASLDVLSRLAEFRLIESILFNNAVSFPRAHMVPALLAQLASMHRIPITIAVHDYFAVCPSHFLLNAEGVYCDLPDLRDCERCLPRNRFGVFTSSPRLTVGEWRSLWHRAFQAATTVLCFSESSVEILRRAFGSLEGINLVLRPHAAFGVPERKPAIQLEAPLRIGILGTINFHKGAAVVQELAERIRVRKEDVHLTIIGTLDGFADTAVVSVTGPYTKNRLPETIERAGVNLMFFPSIWPETFSYVTAEIMQMGLPIVTFDFGAPAERVARYPLGKTIRFADSDTILDQLIGFHEHLKQIHNPKASSV